MQQLVFGLGSGRCGTTSLTKLLDFQDNTSFTHEFYAFKYHKVLPWKLNKESIEDMLVKLFQERDDKIFGDVALYLLNYVEYIKEKYPQSKFICLKRDKEETAKSYFTWTSGKNHWKDHDGREFNKDLWDKAYPNFNNLNKLDGIRKYWDVYYEKSEELSDKFGEDFKIIHMKDLNNKEKMLSLLKDLGIANPKFDQFKIRTTGI